MRNPIATYGVAVALCALVVALVYADGTAEPQEAVKLYRGTTIIAASDPKHATYRPNFTPAACRILKEERWRAEAATKTSGSKVTYKCQVEERSIISFHPAPPPPVRQASLSWVAPTHNDDGSALTDLAGYRIHYGRTPGELVQTIQITNPAATRYVIENLSPGTYFFGTRAFAADGRESELSNIGTKVVL